MSPTARRRPLRRVWLLGAGMWLAAGGVLAAVCRLPAEPVVHLPVAVPWLAVAVLGFLVELCPVHVEYRRASHRVSLSELVMTAGLFFVSPLTLALAYTASGSAVYFVRRRPPVKLFVNSGSLLLTNSVAVLLFRGTLGTHDPMSWPAWVLVLGANLVAAVASVLLIASAIRLADGTVTRAQVAQTTSVAVVGCAAATTLSLTAVTLLVTRPVAVSLLFSTWLVMIVMYRSSVGSRERKQRLGFLYETARKLGRSPEVEESLVELLDEAQARLRAAVAEVTLVAGQPAGQGLRTVTRIDGPPELMVPVHVPAEEHEVFAAGEVAEPVVVGGDSDSPLARTLRSRGIDDAIVAPLYDDGQLMGTVLVGNRVGRVAAGFSEEERRLVATLTGQVALGLQNGRLERALGELTQVKEELRHQALHDPLTGLANRALFGQRVDEALATAAARGGTVAVLFLDLDDFKMVNDTLGHAAGDELLVAVAAVLRQCLREADTPARLGGDEFGVCLTAPRGLADVTEVAERILDMFAEPIRLGSHDIAVRASIGIATAGGEHGESLEAADLLRQADLAMYAAKLAGKSCYEVFDVSMQEQVNRQHALVGDLRVAVDRQQFELHYQPIVGVADGSIAGFEALARWRHPRRGIVLPSEFIPLAEDLNLIGALGAFVLREAVAQVTRWRADTGRDLFMSLNVSSRQLRSPCFTEDVAAVLAEYGLPPYALLLEITETAMVDDVAVAQRCLDGLKSTGVRIAIDDFGTGYSGLQQLLQLPVDVVKIAKPFVDGLLWEGREAALARAIVHLGDALNLGLIAEGVERPEQAARLAEVGCGLAQGFFYGRPQTVAQTERLLADAPRTLLPAAARVIPMQREAAERSARTSSAG